MRMDTHTCIHVHTCMGTRTHTCIAADRPTSGWSGVGVAGREEWGGRSGQSGAPSEPRSAPHRSARPRMPGGKTPSAAGLTGRVGAPVGEGGLAQGLASPDRVEGGGERRGQLAGGGQLASGQILVDLSERGGAQQQTVLGPQC